MGQLVFQAALGGQVNLVGPNTASTFNLNVPAASDTLVARATTDTLTNKTLTSPVISGGTIDNAVIGGTTTAAGSFTTLTTSSTTTLSGGTANGVAYLNGSKALTTGTAFVFDGTNVGIGGANSTSYGKLEVKGTGYQASAVVSTDASGVAVALAANSSSEARLLTVSNHPMWFGTNNTEQMRISSAGNVGIGTNSPASKLHVVGSFRQTGATVPFEWTVNAGANDYLKLNAVGYADNLVVATSAGNVGIGTASPGTTLDVQGTVAGNFYQNLYNASSNSAAQTLYVAKSFGASGVQFGQQKSTANGIINVIDSAALTFGTGNTERARIDSSGNVLVTNVAGLGYGTGSGGTVTQATSKSTSVTLNKPTGIITTTNSALAANTTVQFILSNSLVTTSDNVIVTLNFSNSYQVWVSGLAAGSVYINIRNITAGSLSEALSINFAVIKGATA